MRTILAEKAPFFALSFALAVIILLSASEENVLVPLSVYSLSDRFISSGAAVFDYGALMVYPAGVVLFYLLPYPIPAISVIKAIAVLAVTLVCAASWRKRPWLLTFWCCFLLPLLPALHFFLNGAQSICSHFVYLSSVVFAITGAAGVGILWQKLHSGAGRYRFWPPTLAIVMLVIYLLVMQFYIGSWKNSGTLWTRVIELQPVGRAYYYRADYYLNTGNYGAAVADLRESVRMAQEAGHPEVYTLHAFLGDALRKAGNFEEAASEFTTAIRLRPLPNFFYYRSLCWKALGKSEAADADLIRAGGDTSPISWQYLQKREDLKPVGMK